MDSQQPRARLLVVDDHEDSREVIELSLQGDVFEVTAVADAESALEQVRSNGPFDMLLTDLSLPGMSGEQLAKTLLEEPTWKPKRLVAVSGRALSGASKQLFDKLLTKPIDVALLPDQLLELLGDARSPSRSGGSTNVAPNPSTLAPSEEQLRADEAKARFLSTMAHEIRTPLTPMGAYLHQLGKLTARGELPSPELIAKLTRQMERVAQLADHLSDAGRVDTGTPLSLSLEPVELGELLRSVVDEQRELMKNRRSQPDLSIRLQTPSEPCVVQADRARIAQAARHIVHNAIKFSPHAGSLQVELHAGDPVCIVVRDQGIGIPEAELPNVGRNYFRGSNAKLANYPGLGLGLALTQHIMRGHGGALLVQSTPMGTTAVLSLPAQSG